MSEVPTSVGRALLTQDGVDITSEYGGHLWGIYHQDGSGAVVEWDSVHHVEYARDYNISDYPQEEGSFESYNKVQQPYQAKVGFLIAKTRKDFLNSFEAIAATLAEVIVITPDIAYDSANITHYNYRRDERSGVSMILVEVWVQQVRITGGQQVSSTASQGTSSGGTNISQIGNSNPLNPAGTLTTGSTSAASPQSSGPVQPTSFPAGSATANTLDASGFNNPNVNTITTYGPNGSTTTYGPQLVPR